MEIWKSGNWEKCKIGKMEFWKNENVENYNLQK